MLPGPATLKAIVHGLHRHRELARAATGKGLMRQLVELVYAGTKGFTAEDYYILPLYRGDNWDCLGRRHYSRLNTYLNPACTGVVPFNKWVSSRFFIGAGLPTPAVHGFYHPVRGFDLDRQPLRTPDAVAALLDRCGGDVVLKPVDGGQGRNILVLAKCDIGGGVLTKTNGETMSLDAFHDFLGLEDEGWLIQERVVQHEALDCVHPFSLNTLRIMTLALDDGTVATPICRLRMGRNREPNDNMVSGGIACHIDPDTGRCGPGMFAYGDEQFPHHPDTGTAIEGLVIPHWQAARALVAQAHQLLPFPRDLAWDIGVMPDGPVLIEVNSFWSSSNCQKPNNNLRDLPYGDLIARLGG